MEKKHKQGSGGILYEGMVSVLLLFSKLIRHYRKRLRAVILTKGDCKKIFNKRVPIIVANMFWRKTFIL